MSKYSVRDGFIMVRGETTTYGAGGVTPAVGTHEVYVDEAELEVTRAIIDRTGPSPYRDGYAPVVGPKRVTFKLSTELTPKAITGTGVRPLQDNVLKLGGFKSVESVAGDPKTVTYSLQSQQWGQTSGQESSATIWLPIFNAADDDGIYRKAWGCRGNFELTFEGGQKWKLAVDGMAQGGTKASIGGSRASIGLPLFDFSSFNPVVSGAAECRITAQSAGETYPVASGILRSLRVKGNNGIELAEGPCGQYVDFNGGEVTFDMVLDVVDLDEFDPQQYLGDSETGTALVPDPLLIQIGSPDLDFTSGGVPTVAGSYVMVRFYGYLRTAVFGAAGQAKAWQLTGKVAYDPAGGVAGETPSNGSLAVTFGTKA